MSFSEIAELARQSQGIIAALTFVFGIVVYRAQQRRAVKVQKLQTYQRLELASNDLFRSLSTNAETLAKFEKPDASFNPTAKEKMIADNHIYQALNLFEMAARLRDEDFFDDEVFGSWVIWYYEMLTSLYFRHRWSEIKYNYTKEMRLVFDGPIKDFDNQPDDMLRRQSFFAHVAKKLNCPRVKDWLREP